MKIFAYNDFILKRNETGYFADDSHILFIKSTCENHFDEFRLGSRVSPTLGSGYYFFSSHKKHILELPYYSSVSDFLKNPSLFWKAYRLLKSQIKEFDVFWITWPHPISFLILCMIGKQKPVVLFVRQNLEALIEVRYTGIKKWAGKRFTKFVYAFAAVFRRHAMLVTVGEEMFQVLAPDFNSSRYISDAIVPKAFALPARKKRTPGVLKLLFVGRLEPEKGLPDLIHALKLINEKDQARLTIIGEGVSKIEAETLVRELEIGHKVDFKGYVAFGEQLFDAYASHDILMISSYSEGLPKIINESRAFAIPIVSTKVGGIANELKDGETCLFVNPGMPDQLAEAALRLSADMDLYSLISKNLSLEFQKNSLEFWSEEFFQFVKNHFN